MSGALLADGFWIPRGNWLGNVVRSNVNYDCKLLGKRTNIVVKLVHLRIDESRKSDDFLFTLDGLGIDVDGLDVMYCHWEEILGKEHGGRMEKDASKVKWVKQTLLPMLPTVELTNAFEYVKKHKKHLVLSDNSIFKRRSLSGGIAPCGSRRLDIQVKVTQKWMKDRKTNAIQSGDYEEIEKLENEALKKAGLKPQP